MKANYQNGKIYKIWSLETDRIYIGSTCQKLYERLSKHKSDYKRYLDGKFNYISSFEILKCDDYRIELVEEFPCENKDQLVKREGHFIREFKDVCINQRVMGRTQEEYRNSPEIKERKKMTDKLYRTANQEKISKQRKQFREANKERLQETKKQYRDENKQILCEKQQARYQKNKEDILKKQKEPQLCVCGTTYTRGNKARHEKSQKHQDYIKSLEN